MCTRLGTTSVWLLQKGGRLALGHVVQLRSSILQLLSLRSETELKDGEFRVLAATEEGFQFRVDLNPHLHAFLQISSKDGIREHILTHIVTACLALLQREFKEDSNEEGGWRSLQESACISGFSNEQRPASLER